MQMNPIPNRLGWQCPKCNKIHSPDVMSCWCNGYITTTNPYIVPTANTVFTPPWPNTPPWSTVNSTLTVVSCTCEENESCDKLCNRKFPYKEGYFNDGK